MQRGLRAPPLTCMSYGDEAAGVGDVVDRFKARDMMKDWLRDPTVKLIAHNLAFDTTVMSAEFPELLPLFVTAYEAGRLEDTLLREQLIDIAEGHFRWELDPLTDEVIKRKSYALGSLVSGLDKESFRTHYGPLRDVPIERWEPGYYKYALQDAAAVLYLYRSQERRHGGPVVDSEAQARAGFALQLMSAWGMRTDPEKVLWLEATLEKNVRGLAQELIHRRLIREDGSRDMAAIRQRLADSGITLSYTPTGQISTGSDTLTAAADASHDEGLNFLVKYAGMLKLLTTYVPALKTGTVVPINADYQTLVETGRTSCRRPNLQNLPRGKKEADDLAHYVRECFVPRAGNYFCSTDYDSLEVRTFGQVLFDTVRGTTLKNAYERDPDFDPHTNLASQIMSLTYEEGMRLKKAKDPALLNMRQTAKPAIFGFAGGMGPRKFRSYAWKGYGVLLSEVESQVLRNNWMRSLPEVSTYFARIGAGTEHGRATISQLRSGRVRGGVSYTDGANGFFQALAADGAKHALWEVMKRCYVDRSSVMYGSRPVCFVHDEIIMEVPKEIAHEVALEQERVMCEAMMKFTPDIPSRASPALMKRWYKGADRVFENGRLVPWEPRA